MRSKVNIRITILIIAAFAFLLGNAKAEAKIDVNAGSDIVFVLDVSGSMKSTDATREAINMIQIAADLCKENDRIAFLAYNDTIAYRYDFVAASQDEERNQFKEYVRTVEYSGETDLGLGLKEAVNLHSRDPREGANRYIIMLSDGETDLRRSNTGRTEADSQEDVKESIAYCIEQGIAIHTIGFVGSFSDSVDYLSVLSDSTGGQAKVAASPFLLLDYVSNIMLGYKDGKVNEFTSYVASDNKNNIVIPIPEKDLEQMMVVVYSAGNLEDIEVDTSNNKVIIIREDHYAIVKVNHPVSETMNLTLDYKKGSKVIVSGIEYNAPQEPVTYEGDCEVKKTITKNSKTTLVFSLKDEKTGTPVAHKEFYDELKATITITNTTTDQSVTVRGKSMEGGISADYVFKETGTYRIHVLYQKDGIEGECFRETEVVNLPPESLKSLEERLCISKKFSIYDMSELFSNEDQDTLTYEIIDKNDTYVEAFLDGSRLKLRPVEYGDSSFRIKATDYDGAAAYAQITIHSQPYWKYHYMLTVSLVALGILFVAVIIVGGILLTFQKGRIKSNFRGVMTGNFANLKSKNDVGTMKWNLSRLFGESLTLEDLFQAADVNENLPETDRIAFYMGKEDNLMMFHESHNSVFINAESIPRQRHAAISYGDVIYIGFNNNTIELELTYTQQ